MSQGLKPCPHRQVDDGGRILCGLIRGGDREVSVNLCRACPVPQINCQHLRASMQKTVQTPITVRFATGRVEVWDDEAPTIGFKRAACAEKTMPITSPRDCAGCPLRSAMVIPQSAVQVARRNKQASTPVPAELAQPVKAPARPMITDIPALPAAEANSAYSSSADELVQRAQQVAANKYRESRRKEALPSFVAERPAQAERSENKSKIILLQQWLADQFNKKNTQAKPDTTQPAEEGIQDIVYASLAPTYNEEPGYERCVGWTD